MMINADQPNRPEDAMSLHPTVARVTDRIRARSQTSRGLYLERMAQAVSNGPVRAHLSCGNQAHAYAAMGPAKDDLVAAKVPNLGIVTAYNDMLSAHQPFERYPTLSGWQRPRLASPSRLPAAFQRCAMG
jgi:phosphogluconate dehydratase